jgi:hypothetical protein
VVVPYDVAVILLEKYAVCYSCFNLHVAEVVASVFQCCCNNINIYIYIYIYSWCFSCFSIVFQLFFLYCNNMFQGVSTSSSQCCSCCPLLFVAIYMFTVFQPIIAKY